MVSALSVLLLMFLSINGIPVSFLSNVYMCPFYQWYTCVLSMNGIPVYGIFKVLLLVSKSQLGLAPSYLTDFMRKPMSSLSARPLRPTDRLDLFVPRVRTPLAQFFAFSFTLPS